MATDYELNTFTCLDGRVDIYYGDSGRSADLGRFISERYDDILKSLAQNGVYYTCMDDEIFCIKQTPLQNEGCLLGVQIPSRLFTKSIYNSKNIFLKAVNIFISFNDGEIMQIDMGNKLFSNTKTAEKYITSGFETYDNKGIIITGKNIKNNNYTIIAIQNTDFVTEIKAKIILLLLIAFLIIFFDLLKNIQLLFLQTTEQTLTIGVSGIYKNLNMLHRAWEAAEKAVGQRALLGNGRIIDYTRIDNTGMGQPQFTVEEMHEVILSIKKMNKKAALDIVDGYFEKVDCAKYLEVDDVRNNGAKE